MRDSWCSCREGCAPNPGIAMFVWFASWALQQELWAQTQSVIHVPRAKSST
jgi:hypothetical protein